MVLRKFLQGASLGLVGLLGYLSNGCGMGVYSKDPRAGFVINEVIKGAWDYNVAQAGKTDVKVEVSSAQSSSESAPMDEYFSYRSFRDTNKNGHIESSELEGYNENIFEGRGNEKIGFGWQIHKSKGKRIEFSLRRGDMKLNMNLHMQKRGDSQVLERYGSVIDSDYYEDLYEIQEKLEPGVYTFVLEIGDSTTIFKEINIVEPTNKKNNLPRRNFNKTYGFEDI